MATYYVRSDGSNGNAGTGPATNQAWQTIGKIFASGSVVTGGDIVYIAPGTYTETISVLATSPTSEVQIIGNPTASQFSGVNAGVVKLSAYNSTGTTVVYNNTYLITATSKNYYSFSNLVFETAHTSIVSGIEFYTSRYIKFTKCVFRTENAPAVSDGAQVRLTASASTAIDATFDQCYFGATSAYGIYLIGASQLADTSVIKDCYFDSCQYSLLPQAVTATILNCTFVGSINGIYQSTGSANAYVTVKNCLFKRCTIAIVGTSSVSGVQTYNRFIGCGATVTQIPSSVTSSSAGVFGVDTFESLLFGLNNLQPGTSYADSPNKSFGNATGAPATDLYGQTWTGTSPDAGSATYRNLSAVGAYQPTERNANVITIPPDTTSRAVYVYLGSTGLTFSTTGLAAFYTRGKAAPVAITLVTQTVTGAYTSGGFVEVSSTNQPGIYRLDLPNAALVDGVDDVTVTVRGAAGTNGAVLTISLIAEPTVGAVVVRMGPYQIKADGLGSSQPLDINVGAAQGIDTQVVDANGSGVDITASTLSVKVYDSGGILVATYVGTATYAADGRLTFAITTAVTGTAGTYTATITRTTSASDTQVFGPLRLYVRSV